MHTKDLLAQELRKIGLNEMADRAAEGYYHDYLSPLDLPGVELVETLAVAALTAPKDSVDAIMHLRNRVMNGDFDATKEESDDWASSPEGQAAFRMLRRR